MPQFSVNNLHNIELDHSEYTAITDHFPNNRCTYKNFFLKLKETFTNNNDFLLISNESKWKYQITLCMKENVTSYGIYKTGTTSNEIFRILPPREKNSGSAHELSILCILPMIIVEKPHSLCDSFWHFLFCFFIKKYRRCG